MKLLFPCRMEVLDPTYPTNLFGSDSSQSAFNLLSFADSTSIKYGFKNTWCLDTIIVSALIGILIMCYVIKRLLLEESPT